MHRGPQLGHTYIYVYQVSVTDNGTKAKQKAFLPLSIGKKTVKIKTINFSSGMPSTVKYLPLLS